jgi:hypothetical protein
MKKFINGMPANTDKEINDAVDAALMGGRFVVITTEIPGVNVPHTPTIDLRSNTKGN